MEVQVYFCLLALVVIDFATGIIYAIKQGEFSSSIMREGLLHKGTYLIAIFLCEIVKYLSGYLELGFIVPNEITALACVWIALTEIGSILENIVKINPELGSAAFLNIFAKKGEENDSDSSSNS